MEGKEHVTRIQQGQVRKVNQQCFQNIVILNQYPISETNNNNLLWVARALEVIYNKEGLRVPRMRNDSPQRYRDLTKGSPPLDGSLRQTGKSRADLWAFAGLVAAEMGMLWHNRQCDVR